MRLGRSVEVDWLEDMLLGESSTSNFMPSVWIVETSVWSVGLCIIPFPVGGVFLLVLYFVLVFNEVVVSNFTFFLSSSFIF